MIGRPGQALAAWTALALAGCGSGFKIRTDSYDPALGALGQVDLYQPPPSARQRPGVLVVHGGAWDSGSKADLAPEAASLAEDGFVVASINYRLSPQWHFPTPVQDTWCALAWFRSQAPALGLDPNRVAVLGYSAGGYLVDMVGLHPTELVQRPDCPSGATSPPAAVVAGDGPADLLGLPSEGTQTVLDLIGCDGGGCSLNADPAIYRAASPLQV